MTMIFNLSAGLFSPGQIAGVVIISLLLAGLIALCGYLGYLIHKRGVHKMHTKQLQLQRDALLEKLNDMRSGKPFEFTPCPENKVSDDVEEFAVADSEADDDADETDELIYEEILEEDSGEEVEMDEAGSVVQYNRSFTARVTQSDGDLKARYSELKNYLMSYSGVRSRISWKRELFYIGRKSVASFVVRGKTLCLRLATDPALFEGTKYRVDDVSGRNKNNPLPCMYRIKSDRKTGYAKELIDIVMAGFAVARDEDYTASDFTMPYKSTEVLIKMHLIKFIGGSAIPDIDREDALIAARGIRYNRSFTARIIQSDDGLKARYSKLKNAMLAYDRVRCLDSWKRETYRVGRNCLAALVVRGKTLCLCLATDPAQYDNTKYKVENYTLYSKNTNTPLMYRIKSERRLKYAIQMIDKLFKEKELVKTNRAEENYAVPFTSTDALLRRGLIREVKIQNKAPFNEKPAAAEVALTDSEKK